MHCSQWNCNFYCYCYFTFHNTGLMASLVSFNGRLVLAFMSFVQFSPWKLILDLDVLCSCCQDQCLHERCHSETSWEGTFCVVRQLTWPWWRRASATTSSSRSNHKCWRSWRFLEHLIQKLFEFGIAELNKLTFGVDVLGMCVDCITF